MSAPTTLDIDIRIFVTQPLSNLVSRSEDSFNGTSTAPVSEKDMFGVMNSVKRLPGRPDLKQLLSDEAAMARGPLSVDGKQFGVPSTIVDQL